MAKSFIQQNWDSYRKASEVGIEHLIHALSDEIDIQRLMDGEASKLLTSIRGKEIAFNSIVSISETSELSSKIRKKIIHALKSTFTQCLNVIEAPLPFEMRDEDLQSISKSKEVANNILHLVASKIDEYEENEEAKQEKIDNVKPEVLVEIFAIPYQKFYGQIL